MDTMTAVSIALAVLLVLWLLGLSTLNLGSFAYVFLVVAIIAVVLRFFGGGMGRRSSV
jgi:hypothetical protein